MESPAALQAPRQPALTAQIYDEMYAATLDWINVDQIGRHSAGEKNTVDMSLGDPGS